MKHMTALLGLAFLLSNVTSAITQDQKDFSSPGTALNYLARKCAEQFPDRSKFTPPRPPLDSGETWNQNVNGDGYCRFLVARPLRDAIRQYVDHGGHNGGDCPRRDAFDSRDQQLHAQCT